MAADPTASDIFVPTDGDYAVDVLQRLFGDTIASLAGRSGEATGSAILTTVIGTFNVAVLFFATVVAAYLMYQLFLDTARDGEAGGRENNLAVTALRAGSGAALLLPVKGGFSVVQILVLQLLLWGAGFGDYVWKTTATELQTTATYTASTANSGDSFVTARKLASVLATRTAGYLCAYHANEIDDVLAGREIGDVDDKEYWKNRAIQPIGPIEIRRGNATEALNWYFGTDDRYDARSQMCGSTKLIAEAPPSEPLGNDIYSTSSEFASTLTQITNTVVSDNAIAAIKRLDATAILLAKAIYKQGRNTDAYKAVIKNAVSAETQNFIMGVTNSVTSGTAAQNLGPLKKSFLEATTDNGWMFAGVWQRALASYVTKLNAARNQLSFVNSSEVDPKSAATSVWGMLTGYSPTEKALFSKIDANFDYLSNLEGAYVEAGEPNPSSTTTLEKVAANNQEQSSLLSMQWLYSQMFNASKTPDASTQWNDPLIEIQELGQKTILVGGFTIGGAGLTGMLGKAASVVTAMTGNIPGSIAAASAIYAADIISYFGYALLIAGIILAIMLPFFPFVYFLSGVFGWVIMAIEAVVAAPIWILLTFAPHRSGDIIGTNKQGMLLMIGVFFRPVLMIIGLLACFLVMRVGLDFVNIMFTGIYMIIAPDFAISNMFLALGLIGMYVLTLITIVSNSSALITGLGDAVMEFIGVRVSMLGQNDIAEKMFRALMPEQRLTKAGEDLSGSIKGRTLDAANAGSKKLGNAGSRFLIRGKG